MLVGAVVPVVAEVFVAPGVLINIAFVAAIALKFPFFAIFKVTMQVPDGLVVTWVLALFIEQSPLTIQVFLPFEFEFASSFTEITEDGGSEVSRQLMLAAVAARALEKVTVVASRARRTTLIGLFVSRFLVMP